MADAPKPRRTRVERGIYRQPNGRYAVCARRAGHLHFLTVGTDLTTARRAREELIAALEAGRVPASPRLRLDTVAAHWSSASRRWWQPPVRLKPHRADRSSGGSAFRESRQADAFAHIDRGSPPIQRAP